jgi:hypothetical protein
MTKDNRRNSIILIVGITLLSLVCSNAYSLYIEGNTTRSFNIQGSYNPGSTNYNVNFYLPNSEGVFSLNKTVSVPSGIETVLASLASSNSVSTSDISYYRYLNWCSDAGLTTSITSIPSTNTSDVNVYALYKGYFTKGSSESIYQGLTLGGITINSTTYEASKLVDIGSAELQTYSKTLLSTSSYVFIGNYGANTASGKYRISYDIDTNNVLYERYIRFKPTSDWKSASATFKANLSYNSGNFENFLLSADGSTGFYIGYGTAYKTSVQFLRCNTAGDTQWNYSATINIISNGYSSTEYAFYLGSGWDNASVTCGNGN